jgi:hypothetical protein
MGELVPSYITTVRVQFPLIGLITVVSKKCGISDSLHGLFVRPWTTMRSCGRCHPLQSQVLMDWVVSPGFKAYHENGRQHKSIGYHKSLKTAGAAGVTPPHSNVPTFVFALILLYVGHPCRRLLDTHYQPLAPHLMPFRFSHCYSHLFGEIAVRA